MMTALALTMLLVLPHRALAHAVLVRSNPADHATVRAGDTAIELTFNSRIDAARSSVTLLGMDGAPHTLKLDPHAAPNVLATKASGLVAGEYRLQWQVLASDGHISRGVLTFHVT